MSQPKEIIEAAEASTILIVDDSATARMRLRSVLEKQEFSVIEAAGAKEAVQILKERRVSLVTLDIEMPEVDGYVTCELIRTLEEEFAWSNEENRLPVIFVTGNDTFEGRKRGFEAGAFDFVLKSDIGKGALVDAVNRYMRPNHEFEGCRALIVDDSKLVRVMLARLLQTLGIDPEHAENGQEAYEMLLEQQAPYDLVICDNNMPVMNGTELCQKIRTELGLKDLPVLFLSGTSDREDQLQFFHSGASDHLSKPFIREELIARMKVHIAVSRLRRELQFYR